VLHLPEAIPPLLGPFSHLRVVPFFTISSLSSFFRFSIGVCLSGIPRFSCLASLPCRLSSYCPFSVLAFPLHRVFYTGFPPSNNVGRWSRFVNWCVVSRYNSLLYSSRACLSPLASSVGKIFQGFLLRSTSSSLLSSQTSSSFSRAFPFLSFKESPLVWLLSVLSLAYPSRRFPLSLP